MRTTSFRSVNWLWAVAGALGMATLGAVASTVADANQKSTFVGVIAALEYSGQLDLLSIKDNRVITKIVHKEQEFGDSWFQRSLGIGRHGRTAFVLIPGAGSGTREGETERPSSSHGVLL